LPAGAGLLHVVSAKNELLLTYWSRNDLIVFSWDFCRMGLWRSACLHLG